MSALIRLAKDHGATVSGSDQHDSPVLDRLRREGYRVYAGVDPSFAERADLTVYTGAIPLTHPEIACARRLMERSEFLALCARSFPTVVAVAGTHGKTTCCAFLTSIMKEAGLPFTAHVGGVLQDVGSGYFRQGYDILVTEACEYRAHFLSLKPTVGVISSVEYDHPDYYRTPQELREAFGRFASNCDALVATKEVQTCIGEHECKCIYDDMSIREIDRESNKWEYRDNCGDMEVTMPVWGDFNAYDAGLAIRVARLLGVGYEEIRRGIAAYRGAARRQQRLGTLHGAPVLTDYAHHPTEIASLLSAAKERYGRLCVVFQPHTYSRTRGLLDEFATCFEGADTLLIIPTYAARETGDDGILDRLIERITVEEKRLLSKQKAVEYLLDSTRKYDAYLLVGAGDVDTIAAKLPLGD